MAYLFDGRERTETLQRMLCMLGAAWKDPALDVLVSGTWNEETEAAVRAFQERERMPVTGICDRGTWDAMASCCTAAEEAKTPLYIAVAETEAGPGGEGDAVVQLQLVLRGLADSFAFPSVPLDGCYGSATEGAVYAFQRAAGLPATGKADRATWRALAEAYNAQAGEDAYLCQ